MADWRHGILKEFVPGVGKLALVADPDRLLTEPALSEALAEKGFESILFEEPVAFRFAYESKYRSRLDAGQQVDLVVVYHGDLLPVQSLPSDVLARGRQLLFSLSDLFPNLSYPVLAALEPQYLDLLYDAQKRFNRGVLGENATKDFILRHVFGIAAELIKSEADLLRTLLRRHYRLQVIPPLFLNRLVQALTQTGRFDEWPLDLLFQERSQFFAFLQERWLVFVERLEKKNSVAADAASSKLAIEGPADLPFENPDVKVYVDDLFVEGLLQPAEWRGVEELGSGWFLVGIRRDPNQDRARRLASLLQMVERDLPSRDSRHDEWLGYSEMWAQLVVLANGTARAANRKQAALLADTRERMDSAFRMWAEKRFGALHNLPANPPVVVHHIPRHLANLRANDGASKLALIVVDGLAFDQWLVLRDELSRQKPHWRFEQSAVFAWVPTVTSVSRQAIFAGKAPFYFPSSIYSTEKEPALWLQFWADHGLQTSEVRYVKGLGEPSSLHLLDGITSSPRTQILGLVVDKVDRIMHGMELGTAGMHNQIRQWATEGFMTCLLDLLFSKGFMVLITSDHGNVEAIGCGRPREGALADVRGERVRIYCDEVLRAGVASQFPAAIAWRPLGLPEDFLPLLAPGRLAFIAEGQRTVAHGGITLEELIVPLVRVVREGQ